MPMLGAEARPASRPVFDPWATACVLADAWAVSRLGAASPQAGVQGWAARREQRLARLLAHAQAHSALYRERLARADRLAGREGHHPGRTALERLARLAPVRKHELMRRFSQWVTDPALALPALRAFVASREARGESYLGRYAVWESSGSSGEAGLFVQDAQALAVADALEAVRGPATLDGAGAASGRIALVAATQGHYAGVVAFERLRALNPWWAAHSRSFSFMQPQAALAAALEAFAPTVLATYPSMAWVLAERHRAGRLAIQPRAVWTGGETLSAAQRGAIGSAFGAPVHESYGASECFLIANECRAGRLHLNADWVIAEPVDERGRPVEPGTFGARVLITNLANFVQPIIRYDLGDRVRLPSERCACGSALPLLEVQGRSDDVLGLADAQGHVAHLPPLALTGVLEDEARVFDFQLRQVGPSALELEIFGAPGAPACARAEAALRGHLREHGLANVQLNVQAHRGAAARGRSGKQQRVLALTSPVALRRAGPVVPAPHAARGRRKR